MYDKQAAPDFAGTEQVTQNGYGDQIIREIQELQSLAESLHCKVTELTGTCQETMAEGEAKVARDPQNFCEQTIRDLKRVRRVMLESLENMGNF